MEISSSFFSEFEISKLVGRNGLGAALFGAWKKSSDLANESKFCTQFCRIF